MATVVISNSCICGAAGGLMNGRFKGSATPSDYAAVKNAAVAIAAEFITVNTGSGSPIADADNAEGGFAVYAAAYSVLASQGATSTTATDYLKTANQIYALAKEIIGALA